MINTLEYALIVVIEGNSNSINSKTCPRLLEDEAIKCFKHWRKNGGIYSNIDIYCICVSGNSPQQTTIDEMKKYNVNYIEHYMPETKGFKNGWWCKPLGCAVLEKMLPHRYLIHIDLDMYLYREINFRLDHNACLVYDELDSATERKFTSEFKNNFKPFNTCFMVVDRMYSIFKKWYDELIKLENSYVNNTDYYKKYFTDIEYCKLEEGAFDIISLNLDLNITPIVDIMYGETYTHIKNMSTTKNVCFHHYHLYDKYNLNNYNFIKDKLLFYNEYS
jgi:hypothetical protein